MNDSFTSSQQYLTIKRTDDIKNKIKREFSDLYRGNEILIDRTYLILCECIGRGNFGSVYKGVLNMARNESEEVAVKRLENCKFFKFK